jgi:hypothetical protein
MVCRLRNGFSCLKTRNRPCCRLSREKAQNTLSSFPNRLAIALNGLWLV